MRLLVRWTPAASFQVALVAQLALLACGRPAAVSVATDSAPRDEAGIAAPSGAHAEPPVLPVASAAPTEAPPVDALLVDDAFWLPTARRWAIVHRNRLRTIDPLTKDTRWIQLLDETPLDRVAPVVLAGGEEALFVTNAAGAAGLFRPNGALVTLFPWTKTKDATALAVTPDGRIAALVHDDHVTVGPLNMAPDAAGADENEAISDLETDVRGDGVAFHADGTHLVVTSSGSSQARVFDWRRGVAEGDALGTETGGTFGTIVSPDGRWVAAASEAGHALRVWRTLPWKSVAMLGRAPDCANHLQIAFSADGKTLLGSAGEAWSKTFETGTWRVTRARKKGDKDGYTQLSEDGQTGLREHEGSVEVVRVKGRKVVGTLPTAEPGSNRLSSDGRWLLHFERASFSLYESDGLAPIAAAGRPAEPTH